MLSYVVPVNSNADKNASMEDVAGRSYGIGADPLIMFSLLLAAIIHDVRYFLYILRSCKHYLIIYGSYSFFLVLCYFI